MAEYTLHLSHEEWVKRKKQLGGKFKKAMLDAAYNAAIRGQAKMIMKTHATNSIATGAYLRAWASKRLEDGALLYNDNAHAIYVERGRPANSTRPPIAAIDKWLAVKLHMPESERKNVKFAVATAIARRGVRPTLHMLGSTVVLSNLFSREAQKQVKIVLSKK